MNVLDDLSRPEPEGAPALRLRVVHSRGGPRQGVVPITPGSFGMAAALELGGERLNDAQWRSANQCRLAWRGHAEGWQLLNGSQSLVCALNGERVTVAKPVAVRAGDTLEVGLLRFVIEAGAPDADAVAPTPTDVVFEDFTVVDAVGVEPVLRDAPRPPAAAGLDGFDLRDLVFSSAQGSAAVERAAANGGDPFGVLDIDGAEARPAVDPLLGLLGEATAPPPARSAARPPSAHGAAALRQGPERTSSTGVLDHLHDEFVRVVRDPSQLAGHTDWAGVPVPGAAPSTSVQDLSQQAESFPMMLDILRPPGSIDQVMQDFDPLGRSTLLDMDGPEDVLRLFAPELARSVRTTVPSLTRREHHEVSPDSHVRIGGETPGKDGNMTGDTP